MDRLQKKCFIATSALHGLLVGIVLFGAALMPESANENNVKLFTAYDASKVTDALSSGGEPNVSVPAPPQAKPQSESKPTPPAPKPEPKPEPPVAKPEPKLEPKPEPKPEAKVEPRPEPKVVHEVRNDMPKFPTEKIKKHKLDESDLTPVVPKEKHKIKLNKTDLQETVGKSDDREKAARDAARSAAAAAERARHQRAAREWKEAFNNISKNLSSQTPLVEGLTPGIGGGGEASVNYRDLIASKYYNAWSPPAFLDEETPVVVARVTISRDGNVVSARIIKPSGNSAMDKSISNVLDLVTFFEPFPEGAKEEQRTYTIQFNLQAKRQIG